MSAITASLNLDGCNIGRFETRKRSPAPPKVTELVSLSSIEARGYQIIRMPIPKSGRTWLARRLETARAYWA